MLSTFDLNLLRTLDVLLRERNVTRSATELNVTQQAVSGSLKRLREHFGDPLLVRTKHGLEPTPLAVALAVPVHDALRGIASALETVPAFVPGETKRRFRLAMSDHCSLTVLPLLVADLMRTAPGLTYEVIPINRQAVYDMDLGNLDFLLMPKGHGDQLYLPRSIRTARLFEDRFVCAIDARRASLTLDEYVARQHVVLKVDEGFRSLIEAGWIAAGIAPRITMAVGGFAEMICAVQGTDMVATVHERLATMFARMLAIRVVDCPVPLGPAVQQLHWHTKNDTDPTHQIVRHALLAAASAT